jgi:hypothetical protein
MTLLMLTLSQFLITPIVDVGVPINLTRMIAVFPTSVKWEPCPLRNMLIYSTGDFWQFRLKELQQKRPHNSLPLNIIITEVQMPQSGLDLSWWLAFARQMASGLADPGRGRWHIPFRAHECLACRPCRRPFFKFVGP